MIPVPTGRDCANDMKNIVFTRIAALALTVCMLFATAAAFVPVVSAAPVMITEKVDLSRPQKNMRGHGYYWANRTDTLTLTDLYIDTSDEYGLKITGGATVILEGDNYIKASGAALACAGTVTFKGDGTLTLVSDNMGIYFYSTDDTTTARFLSGTYDITAKGNGIYAPYTAVSFVDGKWTISAPNTDAFAINGHTLKLYGGKMTMDNAVHASVTLDVQALALSVTAAKPALTSDKTLKLLDVALSVGDSADHLVPAEEYAGENCITAKSTRTNWGTSILFGEGVPQFVDVLILLALLASIAAAIAVPTVRARKKAKRARAAYEAAEAEAEAERRARKAAEKAAGRKRA